jgi:hypothetical protein
MHNRTLHIILAITVISCIVLAALVLSIRPQPNISGSTPPPPYTQTTVQPQAEPKTKFSGIGNNTLGGQRTESFTLEAGTYDVHTTHNGNGHYDLALFNEQGKYVERIVSNNGNTDATKTITIAHTGVYWFDYQANGEWSITVTKK